MRKVLNKIILFFNSIAAFALLLSYFLPYLSPQTFPLLSVLSLAVPILIVTNVLFLLYWTIILNRRVLVSLIVLILGFAHISSLYKFGGDADENLEGTVSFLTYNVHSFNRFQWIDSKTIPIDISAMVQQQDPDIFCAQEFYNNPDTDFTQYEYKYEHFNHNSRELALVVFSKFPIVNKGSLDFEKTANNAVYADIALRKDTVRVYNVHLQSHKISSQTNDLANADSQKLLKNVRISFKKQQLQAEALIAHMKSSPYKNVVLGDFNNTAYSYVYNQIVSQNLQDTFTEKGSGFGKTFKFDLFPARIDFILVPQSFEVIRCKTFKEELSDHFPILAKIKME